MAVVADDLLEVTSSKKVLIHLQTFRKRHRNGSILVDMEMWDLDEVQYVGTELFFFIEDRDLIFNVLDNRDAVHDVLLLEYIGNILLAINCRQTNKKHFYSERIRR